MERAVRNQLRSTVQQCRQLLEEAVAEQLEGQYGIHPDGRIEDATRMAHLSPDERQARQEVVDALRHMEATGVSRSDAIRRLIREIAFTHLNRLVAFKMMEHPSRGIIREAVGRGPKSNGFLFYLADHPEDEARWRAGEEHVAYRRFLIWLGREFSKEIGALFSDSDPANRLHISPSVLGNVLTLLNDAKLQSAWEEDETIGWVYQYFTPKEMREKTKKRSQAPRNAHELAFLNQFYTPRYVVCFLVDNTLGRLWYDMREGNTVLGHKCRYLLREVSAGTSLRGHAADAVAEIEKDAAGWRHPPTKKDPREIRVIDPACGSGHFLLYAFDLLEDIYQEAWEDPNAPRFAETGKTLREDYPDRQTFRVEVPRLILRYNLHGTDIDARAVQIAALALWLRAQRSFQEMGLHRDRRPPIERSNLVVAEPMPGEKDFLDEFVVDLEPPLRPLLREAFNRMRQAHELGSLLCIEEELRSVVEKAQQVWEHRPNFHQPTLFEAEVQPTQVPLELLQVRDDAFWQQAYDLLLRALANYSERVSNGRGYSRQLFAQDTKRGFAFVDVSRRDFDVVVMNPPFGNGTPVVKTYLTERFPRSKQDLACAFVDRWFSRLKPGGRLGVIMTRTPFFLSSSTRWREEFILEDGRLEAFADLGDGVLEAMVETAACTLVRDGHGGLPTFFRLVQEPEELKDQALREVITGLTDTRRFTVPPASFHQVPNSPLAYWVSERVRRLFQELPPFEGDGRTVKHGLTTADDFRFVRAWWEVPQESIVTGSSSESPEDLRQQTFEGKRWVPFAKGGEYSPYYADLHLVVNWELGGYELREFPGSVIRNPDFYFRSGLTWSRRTTSGLSVRVLPGGAVFGDKGPGIFVDDPFLVLAIMNSSAFEGLVVLQVGAAAAAARSYEIGVLQRTPFPVFPYGEKGCRDLTHLSKRLWELRHARARMSETSHTFSAPGLLLVGGESLTERYLRLQEVQEVNQQETRDIQRRVDHLVYELYGICSEDRVALEAQLATRASSNASGDDKAAPGSDESEQESDAAHDMSALVADLLSWCIGVVFGRFDVRSATSTSGKIDLSASAPLPSRSPGMIAEGMPPLDYPIEVSSHGILTDDGAQTEHDIVSRVRSVLEHLWGEQADAIEREACDVLGVGDLRSYFRNPRGFFDHHIKRYTRSRRKAPVYWFLQSPKRHYGLWLYYHRLDSDVFFKALTLYVEPKIRHEKDQLELLRTRQREAGTSGRVAKDVARQVERQEEVLADLEEFRVRLERVTELGLKPDLHDGVILNLAPLWELVPWKEPKQYWDALCRGEFGWSSISEQLRERGLVQS